MASTVRGRVVGIAILVIVMAAFVPNHFGTTRFWFLDGPPRAKKKFASVSPFKRRRGSKNHGGAVGTWVGVAILVVVAILVGAGKGSSWQDVARRRVW